MESIALEILTPGRRRLRQTGPLAALVLAGVACSEARPPTESAQRQRIAAMYETYREDFPGVPDLTVEELLALGDDVVVVDVREPREREVSMIPGAVTREAFEAAAPTHSGHRVVTYCTVGYRSGLYAAELRRRGFDAFNLAGSLLAWTHAGQPLVDAEGETRRVHVYGAPWNLVADGYEAVW